MENLLGLRLIIDAALKFPGAASFIGEVTVEVPEELKNKVLEGKKQEIIQREHEA